MSKYINLLNQIKRNRETGYYAISAGDAQITVYEPLTKIKGREEPSHEDMEPKPSSFNTKLLIGLYIALIILFLGYSYIMTVTTKQNVALMEKAYHDMAERYDTLSTEIVALKTQLKDNSINIAFEINSLEQEFTQTKKDIEQNQHNLISQYEKLENKITSTQNLIASTQEAEVLEIQK